ncbi:hypothetical protein C8J57DRAFT_1313868, partial [Mycena rebaudengoi]
MYHHLLVEQAVVPRSLVPVLFPCMLVIVYRSSSLLCVATKLVGNIYGLLVHAFLVR